MNNYLIFRFLCFFIYLQGIVADTCNTPQLGTDQALLITMFDMEHKMTENMWTILCNVVKKFPKNMVVTDYRPGALTTGDLQAIQCPSGSCKVDQLYGCKTMKFKNYSSCTEDADGSAATVLICYCTQESNTLLLNNAEMRTNWNVPDSPMPIFAVQRQYDPCFKIDSEANLQQYLCSIFTGPIGPCT